MWQVGTSPGYKQINRQREKISRERFKPSQRAFKMEQWLCPGGEKSDPAGMFILDRKEAIIVIAGSPLFHSKIF